MGWYADQKARNEAAKERRAVERAEAKEQRAVENAEFEARRTPDTPARKQAKLAATLLGEIKIRDDDTIEVRGQGSAPVAGLHATVESVGEMRSRVTATRLLTTGVFAFALKKKKDDRQLFLTIEGDGVSFLVEVPGKPENQARARKVAAYINSCSPS